MRVSIQIDANEVETARGRRVRRRALRDSFRLIGESHHKLYKHLKFTQSAYARYGLRRRSRKYEADKKAQRVMRGVGKATGEVLPFVYTGQTRQLTMSSSRVTVSLSKEDKGSATVYLNAPVLNRQPWLREEFERVNRQEEVAQEKRGLRKYEQVIVKANKKRPRRRRKRR